MKWNGWHIFLAEPFPQQVAPKMQESRRKCWANNKKKRANKHINKSTTTLRIERKPRDKLKDYLWIFTQLQMNKSVSDVFVFAPWMRFYCMCLCSGHKCEPSFWFDGKWRTTNRKHQRKWQHFSSLLNRCLSRVQWQQYAWKTELIEWKPARRSCRSHQFVECLNIIYHYGIYRFEYSWVPPS